MSDELQSSTVAAFGESALDFLSRANPVSRIRQKNQNGHDTDRKMWADLASNGWLSILIPESEGGLGLGLAELCAVATQTGASLLPEPFLSAGVQLPALLLKLPGTDLRRTLVQGVISADLLAAVAWQEAPGCDDGQAPATTALERGSDFTLSGSKQYVALSGDADGWVVSALAKGETALFWVPQGTAGLHVALEPRADGSVMAALRLDNVTIPACHLLASGDAARSALAYANDVTRIAQGAELLGVARRAMDLALDYARNRVQFGKPIGSFQALQHRLVDAYMQVELCRCAIEGALAAIAAAPAQMPAQASRVKARAAEAALVATRLAIQIHGAMGFTDECDVGLYLKRAIVLAAWLGNGAWHQRRYFSKRQLCPGTLDGAMTEHTDDASPGSPVEFFARDTDWDSVPEAEFRRVVRRFFQEKFPDRLRNSTQRFVPWEQGKDWYLTLSRQGWIAPAWPKAHGGMGLPPDKHLAFLEEQERLGVARVPDLGILMLGPLLIRYGTAEQQKHYLPRILSGVDLWCQGYSEPNAGSDLASLRTKAVLEGDHFVVTGQKIWTSLATQATHIFLLVRTDDSAKPQAGISFLLVDLATPGITIRPIKDLLGHEEFCEVFFDGVRVPRENIVGELNQGWTMAKSLLGFERIHVASPRQSLNALAQLRAIADARGLFTDEIFAMKYAALELDVLDASSAYAHFAEIIKSGRELPTAVSYLKIWSTETYQRICTLMIEAAGEAGGTLGRQSFGHEAIDVMAQFYMAVPASVYGGSNEIQRNIMAKSVLNLPM